jgi:Protein of unknown function (DUF1549)/Protein of unknown function (DUF1553)/Planctomycete cytochrome C
MFSRTFSFFILIGLIGASVAGDPKVEFNRDIRPILSNKCFACHGPDEEHREADLRLDVRDAAITAGADRKAIVPGKPDESELVFRICSEDPDAVMPPRETEKPLTPSEIDLLKRWIAQGAEYQGHWSFLPIKNEELPPLPELPSDVFVRNGIDHFIYSKLADKGLRPSPEADKNTLIRRVYLDLIGLLPTPSEVQQFVSDTRPEAYEELVDRLLKSPNYGERWGRHWLDQARYADSNGYTIDAERVMWPYRDWVIRALNDDIPFDQFTIEQLAGDLLPNATKYQKIATGFHRNTLINQEGGTDPEQFRVEAVIDRVNTTGAVWLGLTIGCAQCHTHKFDPIQHREYYELMAFFNQCADVNDVGPTIDVHAGELFIQDTESEAMRDLTLASAELAKLQATRGDRQKNWEASLIADSSQSPSPQQLPWTVILPEKATAEQANLTVLEDQSVLATQGILREIYVLESGALPDNATIGSFQLRVIPHESLPKNGPGLAGNGNFVLTAVEFYLDDELLPLSSAFSTHAQPNYPVANLIDGNPGTGWAINVAAGSTTVMNSEHTAWLNLGRVVAAGGKKLRIVLKHELNNDYNLGRFQLAWSSQVAESASDPKLLEAIRIAPQERSKEQREYVETAFAAVDAEYKSANERINSLRQTIGLGPQVNTMVMRDVDQRRPTYILTRGDFLRPDKEAGPVEPNVCRVLPPLNAQSTSSPPTRLDLARWLVSKNNPLTPRVTVNRIWMQYFGRGIVETENDFGTQGANPTHPELLDWLASQFIENGWSQKQLHRLIVTSGTYRQASIHRDDIATNDPLNLFLGRQNRLRLDAEIVRDVALSASGKLSPVIGGPSVLPPQPEGVYAFTQNSKNWKAATDANRYRRGMYTMFYRSAPYPMLSTFDTPDFQSVCTRRVRSNTPLQALTMANDESMFELAQGLAMRVLAESTTEQSDPSRLDQLMLLSVSRRPNEKESQSLTKYLTRQRQLFSSDSQAATSIAGPKDKLDIPESELAAWTAVARAVMNTDEFITRE